WALLRRGEEGDLAKALESCRQAQRLDPDMPEAFGLLGVIAFKQGSLREAEAALLHSIQLDPIRGFHTDLGALYVQMGRYTEAEEQLEKAIKNHPDEAYARIQRGNLYLLTERPKEALGEFRAAVALEPLLPDGHKALAIAFMEADKLTEAELALRKAIA